MTKEVLQQAIELDKNISNYTQIINMLQTAIDNKSTKLTFCIGANFTVVSQELAEDILSIVNPKLQQAQTDLNNL